MGQLTSLRFFTPSIQHRARHSRCTLITRVDCELRVASSSPFHLHHPFEISRASRERERERAPLYREERPHRVNKCKYQKGRERRRELLSLRWICLLPSFFFSFFFLWFLGLISILYHITSERYCVDSRGRGNVSIPLYPSRATNFCRARD